MKTLSIAMLGLLFTSQIMANDLSLSLTANCKYTTTQGGGGSSTSTFATTILSTNGTNSVMFPMHFGWDEAASFTLSLYKTGKIFKNTGEYIAEAYSLKLNRVHDLYNMAFEGQSKAVGKVEDGANIAVNSDGTITTKMTDGKTQSDATFNGLPDALTLKYKVRMGNPFKKQEYTVSCLISE